MAIDSPSQGLFLSLFAYRANERASERLEERIKRFFSLENGAENLDHPSFARIFGSKSKADYLLSNRQLIVELKSINGDPVERLERLLNARFSKPGSPYCYGRLGVASVVKLLPDQEEIEKKLADLASRAVRKDLAISAGQVAATKDHLHLSDAAGLAILLNDSTPSIEAGIIGYAIGVATSVVEGGYPSLSYIWANIESHRIHIPGIGLGFPQLLAWRQDAPEEEMLKVRELIVRWAEFNNAHLFQIDHRGQWDALAPVFFDSPPILQLH